MESNPTNGVPGPWWRLLIVVCIPGITLTGCSALPSRSMSAKQARIADELEREFSVARLAERQNNRPRAKEIYTSILKQNENHTDSLHRMGVLLARDARYHEAQDYFRRAIHSGESPGPDLLTDMGYAYLLQGNYQEAQLALFRSLENRPNDRRTLNNLGLALGMQGEYHRAARLFERAGDMASARANLAYVMSQRGDIELATHQYHQALESDDELAVAAQALLQLIFGSRRIRKWWLKPRAPTTNCQQHLVPRIQSWYQRSRNPGKVNSSPRCCLSPIPPTSRRSRKRNGVWKSPPSTRGKSYAGTRNDVQSEWTLTLDSGPSAGWEAIATNDILWLETIFHDDAGGLLKRHVHLIPIRKPFPGSLVNFADGGRNVRHLRVHRVTEFCQSARHARQYH